MGVVLRDVRYEIRSIGGERERERERLAQEYLDLRQGTKTAKKIIKMFIERVLFCPEFAASK